MVVMMDLDQNLFPQQQALALLSVSINIIVIISRGQAIHQKGSMVVM